MESKKVVVSGGGSNTVFKVSSYGDTFYIYKLEGIFGTERKIGETRSFEDALTLIRSFTGKDVESISNW